MDERGQVYADILKDAPAEDVERFERALEREQRERVKDSLHELAEVEFERTKRTHGETRI